MSRRARPAPPVRADLRAPPRRGWPRTRTRRPGPSCAPLLDADDEAAVADRFAGRLAFGTAGLRGPLRAGPNGMNRAVVRRTAAGLAAYLRARRASPARW